MRSVNSLAPIVRATMRALRQLAQFDSDSGGRCNSIAASLAKAAASPLQLAGLLLRQPAPVRGEGAAVAGSGARGFHRAAVHLARGRGVAQSFQRLAVVVEPLRIVGPPVRIDLQFASRVR